MKQPSSTTPSKQKPSTPAKSETKPAQNAKQATPAAEKEFDKTQLFINSIKESVTISELKALYPKAKGHKLQKRKVGPNKHIQYVITNFSFP